jgi:hypothetical protein
MPFKYINISIPIPTAIMIVIAAVLLWIYTLKSCETDIINTYPQTQVIDSLSRVIIELQRHQQYIDGLIIVQETQLDKMSHQIDSTSLQLQETRKQYDAKIKNIYSYTDTQLERFFAARYK